MAYLPAAGPRDWHGSEEAGAVLFETRSALEQLVPRVASETFDFLNQTSVDLLIAFLRLLALWCYAANDWSTSFPGGQGVFDKVSFERPEVRRD